MRPAPKVSIKPGQARPNTLIRWVNKVSDEDAYEIGMLFASKAPTKLRMYYLEVLILRLFKAKNECLLRDFIRELVMSTSHFELNDLINKFQRMAGDPSLTTGSRLRRIFISVLGQTDISVEKFIGVEWQYWKTKEQLRTPPDPPPSFLSLISPSMPNFGDSSAFPSGLTMNQLMYAEATFMRIFRSVSEWGLHNPKIILRELLWKSEDIAQALREGKIDIAVYNAYLDPKSAREFERSPSLLAWNG